MQMIKKSKYSGGTKGFVKKNARLQEVLWENSRKVFGRTQPVHEASFIDGQQIEESNKEMNQLVAVTIISCFVIFMDQFNREGKRSVRMKVAFRFSVGTLHFHLPKMFSKAQPP